MDEHVIRLPSGSRTVRFARMSPASPLPSSAPRHAMVLAAGLGTRMRPLTVDRPKPLVPVCGKALIDHVLDKLAIAGVESAVINVHYFADQIEAHVATRRAPKIVISDERSQLLGTGGGVVHALPKLGAGPFFLVNSDTLWIDGTSSNLARMARTFDPARMDVLLLLATTTSSIGYSGRGDFSMGPDGMLRRRGEREVVPFVYAGAAIFRPEVFAEAPPGDFALTAIFDRAAAEGRLHGLRLDGMWMHVGTPDAVVAAEAAIVASAA
jgi:MurNAc alpha-1-phosphate uridylyltransferase